MFVIIIGGESYEIFEMRFNILDNKIDVKIVELLVIIQVSYLYFLVYIIWFEYVRVWFWIKLFLNLLLYFYLIVYFFLVYEYYKIFFEKKEVFLYWFRIRFMKKC